MGQRSLRVAVLGTRGIPNEYGGFEQFAEYLAKGLVDKGHQVSVYNPHFHEYQHDSYEGVEVIHKFSPEHKIGAAANFIYDYICLRDAVKKDFDVILECGYGTASVSYYLIPTRNTTIVTNMDGLEWKRQKWSAPVRKLMKLFEVLGVRGSDVLVSDNEAICDYFRETYDRESLMIPYGADVFNDPEVSILDSFGLTPDAYYMLIARLEPENNIEMILDGYLRSGSDDPFIVIGDHDSGFGDYLKEKFKDDRIRFLGGIYENESLNNLRYHARAYFHGHSVGGTNPSLLEAMGCGSFIIAHDNNFNKNVLNDNAWYFRNSFQVSNHIQEIDLSYRHREKFKRNNLIAIETKYSWENIIEQYESLFLAIAEKERSTVKDPYRIFNRALAAVSEGKR